ncbi:hypothetical protein BC831DRAFT_111742 [Entophlyctis helioformis]|nr:hypothetical protein BC831DRAFT_111742 [Entophlyctis helioformis]
MGAAVVLQLVVGAGHVGLGRRVCRVRAGAAGRRGRVCPSSVGWCRRVSVGGGCGMVDVGGAAADAIAGVAGVAGGGRRRGADAVGVAASLLLLLLALAAALLVLLVLDAPSTLCSLSAPLLLPPVLIRLESGKAGCCGSVRGWRREVVGEDLAVVGAVALVVVWRAEDVEKHHLIGQGGERVHVGAAERRDGQQRVGRVARDDAVDADTSTPHCAGERWSVQDLAMGGMYAVWPASQPASQQRAICEPTAIGQQSDRPADQQCRPTYT